MEEYPHCTKCKKLVSYMPYGYIDCQVWGACLGYNNAVICPFYERIEQKDLES